jgi:hypothetical protein
VRLSPHKTESRAVATYWYFYASRACLYKTRFCIGCIGSVITAHTVETRAVIDLYGLYRVLRQFFYLVYIAAYLFIVQNIYVCIHPIQPIQSIQAFKYAVLRV